MSSTLELMNFAQRLRQPFNAQIWTLGRAAEFGEDTIGKISPWPFRPFYFRHRYLPVVEMSGRETVAPLCEHAHRYGILAT